MGKRYMSIWFRFLKTDWYTVRNPSLKEIPFVLAAPEHGKMIVRSSNATAQKLGIYESMAVADARAIIPSLQVSDDNPALSETLLQGIAKWCIRYTPVVATDLPDGLILDISGCAHLWGGEQSYLEEITGKLKAFGYFVRLGIADTIGAAWASARFL